MKNLITRRTFVGGVAGAAGVAAFGGPSFAQARAAERAGRAQRHRRRRQSGADAEGHRKLPQGEAEPRFAHHLHQGAGSGTRRQDQGAAGCRPRRHRSRADRHRCVVRRHRAEALGRSARHACEAPCRSSTTSICRPRRRCRRWPKGRASSSPIIRPVRCSNTCPTRVKTSPTTAEELLAWTKANPNRLIYARPANSGPGRTFIMGLPYILGDSNPQDPAKGWDKTWAYLKELGQNIEYYPSGTGAVMKELGEGSRDMTVSTTGWDINPRVLGVVPKEAKVGGARRASTGLPTRITCACRRACRTRSRRCCSTS